MFLSCSSNESNQPKNIMSEDEMVNFLFDINIINSSTNQEPTVRVIVTVARRIFPSFFYFCRKDI